MNISLARTISLSFLLAIVQIGAGICQNAQVSEPSGDQQGMAVLPFEIRGVTPDEGTQLRQLFAEALAESKRFEILPSDVMKSMLAEAGLTTIDSCNTPPCLAQLGKVLHVEKVVHVSVDRWRDRFILHVRLVRAADGALLYDERTDYTGQFGNFLSVVVPEQGRKLSYAYLDKPTSWYLIAAAVIVGVSVIYWIYTTFASTSNTQAQIIGPAQGPQ